MDCLRLTLMYGSDAAKEMAIIAAVAAGPESGNARERLPTRPQSLAGRPQRARRADAGSFPDRADAQPRPGPCRRRRAGARMDAPALPPARGDCRPGRTGVLQSSWLSAARNGGCVLDRRRDAPPVQAVQAGRRRGPRRSAARLDEGRAGGRRGERVRVLLRTADGHLAFFRPLSSVLCQQGETRMAGRKLKTVTRTQGNNQALKDGSVRPKTFEFDFVEVDPLIAA